MLTKDGSYYISQSKLKLLHSYQLKGSRSGANFSQNSLDKSPKNQNAMSNIYDQLKQANTKLKEGQSQSSSMSGIRQQDESVIFKSQKWFHIIDGTSAIFG